MYEPAAAITFTRLVRAADSLSGTIAGFALLAGTRAFTFTALLAWREPVMGGAGLVLLALIGWLRWRCCSNVSTQRAASCSTKAARPTAQAVPATATIGRHASQGRMPEASSGQDDPLQSSVNSHLKETSC
ncbi:hypothetical protein PQQ51_26715 [Paraburkholderia xenovorans]|uniref:hypothetical protein n=1 Tax=Paraburkholderia xenovorans TaxID=36873 RepID=UPI0038B90E6F